MQNKNNLIIGIVVIIAIIVLAISVTRNGEESVPADANDDSGAVVDDVTTVMDAANNGESSDMMTVYAFFGNKVENPETLECSKVYPVPRMIPRTVAVARAAIGELLVGLKSEEVAEGYTTAINEGVKLQSLTIENGVAKVDFSSKLGDKVGGSCLVAAIRAQIEQTLKQFPTVKSVILSVNGNVEDVLQP